MICFLFFRTNYRDSEWFLAGKIFSHGLVMCGYWPWELSAASIVFAITRQVSDHLLLESWSHSLAEEDAAGVREAPQGQIGDEALDGLLQNIGCMVSSNEAKENWERVFLQLAQFRASCRVLRFSEVKVRIKPSTYEYVN